MSGSLCIQFSNCLHQAGPQEGGGEGQVVITFTRKFPVNSNGLHGEVVVQLSLYGPLLLTQPLHSSEQRARSDLEFSSDFGSNVEVG